MPDLTAPEIVSLIEACAKHGVTHFKAGAVEVAFSGHRSPVAAQPVSQTAELAQAIQEAKDWMEQTIPAPLYPEDVETE